MPHPGWSTDFRADVPAKIDTGLGGAQAGEVHDETERRKDEPVAAPAPRLPELAGGVPGGVGVLPPAQLPPAPIVPDRWHKEAGGAYAFYVMIGMDHGTADIDVPTNPGYRTKGVSASSINDGYTKAIALAQLLKPGLRGCLIVVGGFWVEDLELKDFHIDLVGIGRPKIFGHVTTTMTLTSFSMTGFECVSPDNAPSMHVGPRSPLPLGRVAFTDVWWHGPQRGFLGEAQCYFDNCRCWADTFDPSTSSYPFDVHAAPFDSEFSIATNCELNGFIGYDMTVPGVPAPGLRRAQGYAIRASGKFGGLLTGPYIGGLMLRTDAYQMKPTSGLKLRKCIVNGSLRCETWIVQHDHCECFPGLPSPTRSGGTYARISGWLNLGAATQIPGIVQFDFTKVHGGYIGDFVPDDAQPPLTSWGGAIYFRHSDHLPGHDGAEAVACFNANTIAEFFHDGHSSTPCAAWTGGAFSDIQPDNTTGAGVVLASMFDPFVL